MGLASRLLGRFTDWALEKNGPGGYAGEDDPRWAYTIVGDDGSPYLTRILFSRLLKFRKLGFGVYLHRFHRPDGDQDLHNHPWKWAYSFILSGSYTEEKLKGISRSPLACCDICPLNVQTETRRVRWFNHLTHNDYHSVRATHGDVYTLFIVGPRVQDWGFLVDGKHVPWRKYLGVE